MALTLWIEAGRDYLEKRISRVLYRMFGDRPWKPYALGLVVVCFAVSIAIFTGQTALGHLLTGPVGIVVGIAAMGTAILLTVGWWRESQTMIERGLFLSIGVWGTNSALLTIDAGLWDILTWLAIPWLLVSSASWWLEVRDKEPL